MPVIATLADLQAVIVRLVEEFPKIEDPWDLFDELINRHEFNDQLVIECVRATRPPDTSEAQLRAAAHEALAHTLVYWTEAGEIEPIIERLGPPMPEQTNREARRQLETAAQQTIMRVLDPERELTPRPRIKRLIIEACFKVAADELNTVFYDALFEVSPELFVLQGPEGP